MGYWPDPTPFEAADGSVSASLETLIRGPGAALPGLLLVGDPGAGRAAAGETAIRIARAWVGTGRRVILADLDFAHPGLHELLGVPNDEGVADHFAFGTSFTRLARPVEDGAWSLVPAGPWVDDRAAVLRSAGWARLLQELADADATVLAYAPADAPGLAELAERFGAVALLGNVPAMLGVRPFSVVAAFRLPGVEIREAEPPEAQDEEPPEARAAAAEPAILPEAPAEVAGASPPERESADAAFERIRLPTDARAREALIADLRYRQRAARMAPPSDAFRRPSLADLDARAAARSEAAATAAGPAGAGASQATSVPVETVPPRATVLLGEPPLPARRAPLARRRSRARLWWTLAIVALLSLLAGSWHFWSQRRAARRQQAQDAAGALEVPLALPKPVASAPAAPPAADTILAYAVSLGEHVRLPAAEQRVAQLRASAPGRPFFISPIVRNDALYYDVLIGPASDSLGAAVMLDSLSAGGRNGISGQVRLAPYAFLLGDYATAAAAAARVASLRRLEIPSYTVPLAGPPARFRVYAGGYTGPVDAEVMKQILQSVGEPDVLVPRTGKR